MPGFIWAMGNEHIAAEAAPTNRRSYSRASTQDLMFASSTLSGTAPLPSTSSWKARMSKPSPSFSVA